MVTTVGALRTPVPVDRVTVTPDNAALTLFNAMTVIVELVEPSDFTVKGDAVRRIEAADTVEPPPDVPVRVMMTASDELLVPMVALALRVSCKLIPELFAPVV